MIEIIESKINDVLTRNIDINSKRNAVKGIIDAIPSTNVKMAFLHAFKNYDWSNKKNQELPEFKLTTFESIRSNESAHFPGWAQDIFDSETFLRSSRLVDNARRMLSERNLPNGLYSIMVDDIEDECQRNGQYSKNDTFHMRRFSYDINHDPGNQILINIVENREEHRGNNKETYVDNYDIRYQDGYVITDSRLSLDENKPEEVCSRRLYVDSKKTLEEFYSDQNTGAYTKEDITFINNLGEVDPDSLVFKNAINNNLNYCYKTFDEYLFSFSFGKDKDVLDFTYSFSYNGKRLSIYGDCKEVKVVIYSTLPDLEAEYTLSEFMDGIEESSLGKKVKEVLAKLESLGVNIVYSKTEDNKLGGKNK